MRTFGKLATALFLFALLVPLAASAASPKTEIHKAVKVEHSRASFLSRVWELAYGIWTKEGLGIDPSGGPAPVPGPSSHSNIGLGIDPSGSSTL